MRSREEIEADFKILAMATYGGLSEPKADILLEVLLDIRDLLMKKKPKGKLREEYEKKF